jgi:hypothetical protein
VEQAFLGHHDELVGRTLDRVLQHAARGKHRVGELEHVRTAFGMRHDDRVGVPLLLGRDMLRMDALVSGAEAVPDDDFDIRDLLGDPVAEVAVGREQHTVDPKRADNARRVRRSAAHVRQSLHVGARVHIGDDGHARVFEDVRVVDFHFRPVLQEHVPVDFRGRIPGVVRVVDERPSQYGDFRLDGLLVQPL